MESCIGIFQQFQRKSYSDLYRWFDSFPVGQAIHGPACVVFNGNVGATCLPAFTSCLNDVPQFCSQQCQLVTPDLAKSACKAGCRITVGYGCILSYDACLATHICITQTTTTRSSFDPNDLVGIPGVAAARWVSGQPPVSYVVSFANESTATVPAQQVIVTDLLNTNLDMSTLALASLSVPGVQVPIPPTFLPAAGQNGVSGWRRLAGPLGSLLVNIERNSNPSTGLITWTFSSTDPGTRLPPINAVSWFPAAGQGGGSLRSAVKVQAGSPTGTLVTDQSIGGVRY